MALAFDARCEAAQRILHVRRALRRLAAMFARSGTRRCLLRRPWLVRALLALSANRARRAQEAALGNRALSRAAASVRARTALSRLRSSSTSHREVRALMGRATRLYEGRVGPARSLVRLQGWSQYYRTMARAAAAVRSRQVSRQLTLALGALRATTRASWRVVAIASSIARRSDSTHLLRAWAQLVATHELLVSHARLSETSDATARLRALRSSFRRLCQQTRARLRSKSVIKLGVLPRTMASNLLRLIDAWRGWHGLVVRRWIDVQLGQRGSKLRCIHSQRRWRNALATWRSWIDGDMGRRLMATLAEAASPHASLTARRERWHDAFYIWQAYSQLTILADVAAESCLQLLAPLRSWARLVRDEASVCLLEHHCRSRLELNRMQDCVRRWRGSMSCGIVGSIVGRAATTRRAWLAWLGFVTDHLRISQGMLVAVGRHAWFGLERGTIAFALNALNCARSSTMQLLGHETCCRKVLRAWATKARHVRGPRERDARLAEVAQRVWRLRVLFCTFARLMGTTMLAAADVARPRAQLMGVAQYWSPASSINTLTSPRHGMVPLGQRQSVNQRMPLEKPAPLRLHESTPPPLLHLHGQLSEQHEAVIIEEDSTESGEAALLLGAEVEAALQRLNARACTISPVSLLR